MIDGIIIALVVFLYNYICLIVENLVFKRFRLFNSFGG